MGVFQPFTGMPGFGSEKIAKHRTVSADGYLEFLPGGVILDGSKMRDPDNPDYNASTNPLAQLQLRPGLLIGKVTSGSKWANSVIGTSSGALAGTGTTLTLASAQQAVELVRRVGATGTFKLTGPPTAAGAVRTLTATYSAISGDEVTITALGVSDVWTLTAPAGQDAGFYQLEVTTGKGTSAESVQTTAALAANANTATVDAAVEALSNVGAGNVAAVYADPTLTLTFSSNLGPVHVRVLADTTNDGGVFEGGWAAVHTTTGVDGRFVTESLIQPTDGSETIRSFLPDGWELYMPLDSTDLPLNHLPIVGNVDLAKLLPYPADTSLRQWIRDQLNTYGKFVFTEKY